MSARILLVCPDPAALTTMTGALAGHFPVLAASSPETALGLIKRHGPCDAAFCQVFDNPESGMAFAASLSRASPGIVVIALTRSPCPDALLSAAMDGGITGVCLVPMTPESLLNKVRRALNTGPRRRSLPALPTPVHLTREEVNFLLGRAGSDHAQAARRDHSCGVP